MQVRWNRKNDCHCVCMWWSKKKTALYCVWCMCAERRCNFAILVVVCTLSQSLFFWTVRAKYVWDNEDVDDVFDTVLEYLDHLRGVIKKKTATDKGWTSTATVTIRFPVLLLLTFCCLCVCVLQNTCRGWSCWRLSTTIIETLRRTPPWSRWSLVQVSSDYCCSYALMWTIVNYWFIYLFPKKKTAFSNNMFLAQVVSCWLTPPTKAPPTLALPPDRPALQLRLRSS